MIWIRDFSKWVVSSREQKQLEMSQPGSPKNVQRSIQTFDTPFCNLLYRNTEIWLELVRKSELYGYKWLDTHARLSANDQESIDRLTTQHSVWMTESW